MTTGGVRDAWKKVGDDLSALGLKLELHFEEERSDTNEEARDALRRLAEVLDDTFESVADAAKDPAVRDDLRRTARSFADALSLTLGEAGNEIRQRTSPSDD